jgi:predicted RNase H-related nuclease YkuK (DUF458 family)
MFVSVGTDSRIAGKFTYKFATVIAIRLTEDLGDGIIVGRGGCIIHTTYHHKFKTNKKELVNERMLFEVSKSIEVAYLISDLLNTYNIQLEIHADINPNPKYESNKALQESIGYILGMGYNFKVKPNSYTSSNADTLC